MLLLFVLLAKIWAADGWILLGVELINGLVLFVEDICEAAADVLLLMLLLLLSGVDELIVSTLGGRTAVGLTGYKKKVLAFRYIKKIIKMAYLGGIFDGHFVLLRITKIHRR